MIAIPPFGSRSSDEVAEMLVVLDDWHDNGVDLLRVPDFLRHVFGVNRQEARLVLGLWFVVSPGHGFALN